VISFAKDARKPRRRNGLCAAPTAMGSMVLVSNNIHWDCTDPVPVRPCNEGAPASQDEELHAGGPANPSHQVREGKAI